VDSKAEVDQINLAHVTKTNKRKCPRSSVQVQDPSFTGFMTERQYLQYQPFG